jgi:hypothetical protein
MEGPYCGQEVDLLSWNLPRGAEENHEEKEPQSLQSVSEI